RAPDTASRKQMEIWSSPKSLPATTRSSAGINLPVSWDGRSLCRNPARLTLSFPFHCWTRKASSSARSFAGDTHVHAVVSSDLPHTDGELLCHQRGHPGQDQTGT